MRKTLRFLAKWIGTPLLFLVVALCLAPTVIPPFLDRIYYEGPRTAHYDGARFFNPDGEDTIGPPGGNRRGGRPGFFFGWLTGNDGRVPWPRRVAVNPGKPPARVDGERMLATWVGHATVLIQTQGLNILTDPIWNDNAGPFGIGPIRVAEPGVRFENLPKIDLVLVSHNHYDHLDIETLRRLWKRDQPMIVTSLGNDRVIAQSGAKARAIDWGQGVRLGAAEVRVTRNHHWGSRWFADRNRALWSSFVVVLPGGNIFFAGDTGPGDLEWPAEAAACGPVRFAMIPIGAFRFAPGQMVSGSHIGPIDAVRVFNRLGASRGLAIHWGTFRLSYEGWSTPPKLLDIAMRCAGYADLNAFRAYRFGQSIEVPLYAAPRRSLPSTPYEACVDTPAVRALP